jgi:hypothetical protein
MSRKTLSWYAVLKELESQKSVIPVSLLDMHIPFCKLVKSALKEKNINLYNSGTHGEALNGKEPGQIATKLTGPQNFVTNSK